MSELEGEESEIASPTSDIKFKCVEIWSGDGNCDAINNKEDCMYDNGDCCMNDCRKLCGNSQCVYECGMTSPYDCVNPASDCQRCGINPDISYNPSRSPRSYEMCASGEECPYEPCTSGSPCSGRCKGMGSCLASTAMIDRLLTTCIDDPWYMGNGSSANYYCGKDPKKTIVHDIENPDSHYPGCGFTYEQCTYRPCCDDLVLNGIDALNCDKTTQLNITFLNPVYIYIYIYIYSVYRKVWAMIPKLQLALTLSPNALRKPSNNEANVVNVKKDGLVFIVIYLSVTQIVCMANVLLIMFASANRFCGAVNYVPNVSS